MINIFELKNSIEPEYFFRLAINQYFIAVEKNNDLEKELPNGSTTKDIVIKDRSISILLEHDMILTPSFEIRLNLYIRDAILPIGYYCLILDMEKQFVDEFLVFNPR